jgi:hypothetical protein
VLTFKKNSVSKRLSMVKKLCSFCFTRKSNSFPIRKGRKYLMLKHFKYSNVPTLCHRSITPFISRPNVRARKSDARCWGYLIAAELARSEGRARRSFKIRRKAPLKKLRKLGLSLRGGMWRVWTGLRRLGLTETVHQGLWGHWLRRYECSND